MLTFHYWKGNELDIEKNLSNGFRFNKFIKNDNELNVLEVEKMSKSKYNVVNV